MHVVEESLSRYRKKWERISGFKTFQAGGLVGLNALIAGTDMSGNEAQLEMLSRGGSGPGRAFAGRRPAQAGRGPVL